MPWLDEQKVGSRNFDVRRTNPAIFFLLWVNKGVIVGAPTYETGLFPYGFPFRSVIRKG